MQKFNTLYNAYILESIMIIIVEMNFLQLSFNIVSYIDIFLFGFKDIIISRFFNISVRKNKYQ